MKKEKVLVGVVVALIAIAIIYATVYFTVLAKPENIQSPSDSPIQLSPRSHSVVSFLVLFGAATLIMGGVGFIFGEKEKMQKSLESEKKLKKLDDLSLVRLTHHAQKEIYQGKHHSEILAKLKTEGWHDNTIKNVKSNLHIPGQDNKRKTQTKKKTPKKGRKR